MSIAIIGAGNIGAAMAKGLVLGKKIKPEDIYITDIRQKALDDLAKVAPGINIVSNDYSFISHAKMVIVAVKPWVSDQTFTTLAPYINYKEQIVVSFIAGYEFADMSRVLERNGQLPACFRVIPNTALEICQSMNMVSASSNATQEQKDYVLEVFNSLGKSLLIEEKLLSAGTALASCGIAYAFRYIRAAMTGGIEMGFYPSEAEEIVVQTVLGAAMLLDTTKNHPEIEVDKVTTPMGITIKGLNEMELAGFTSSVIRGLKASNL